MLNIMKQAPYKMKEFPVLAGSTFGEEGMAVVVVIVDGVEYVKPSTGTNTEIFIGVTNSDNESIATKAVVEIITVPDAPGPYTVQLTKTNIVGATDAGAQIYVVRTADYTTTMAAQANTGAVNATNKFHVARSTGLMTFNSADAGVEVFVQYRYYTTVAEVKMTDWERSPNNVAGDDLAQMGVLMGGYVETNMYDATKNYVATDGSSPIEVTTGAGGLFSSDLGGLGCAAVGYVTKTPSADSPFLGIRFYEVPKSL